MFATVRLAGSNRHFHHAVTGDPNHLGPLSDHALASPQAVTVHLREVAKADTLAVRMARQVVGPRPFAAHLTATQLRDAHGAGIADVAAVAGWAASVGLELGSVDLTTRRLELTGPLGALANAFAVRLEERQTTDWRTGAPVRYRDHREELRIPADLDRVITAVLGLSDRPLARPRLTIAPAAVQQQSFSPEALAHAYDFPILEHGGAGSTITIGIAELGGAIVGDDLTAMRAVMPRLRVLEEGIDGARPRSDPFGADTEVALDWQVIARVMRHCAPAADVLLVVRYAPNTDRGFTDLIASFASDGRDYAAVSTSWGSPEDFWTPSAMETMDRALQMSAARGIAHCVAAGDNGSSDGRRDGRAHADHPASAPHAVGCGGTTLRIAADGSLDERVWNERRVQQGSTGGGVSGHFTTPHFQAAAGVLPRSANDGRPGRGVPDVAANADPLTGYRFTHQGNEVVVGGTSAVAPLWSALIGLAAARAGHRFGLVHPALYAARRTAFRDITTGDNGAYRAEPGWDGATGLGSPRGIAVSRALAVGLEVASPHRRRQTVGSDGRTLD